MRPLPELRRDALLYASRAANRGWAPPDWLTINLTLRCNLSCVMCTTCYDAPELDLGTIQGLIDQASAWGVRVFNPLGGEAFVRKDLEDILAHAVARRMFVTLTTNGTLITPERAARIARLPPEQLHINVSFDGLEADHDAVRGAGTFKRTVQGYRALRAADASAGQPRRTIVANVILHRRNLARFEALLGWLADEGFSGVQVLNLFRNPADPGVGGLWFQPEDLAELRALVGRIADASPLPIRTPRADLLRIPRYYTEALTPLEAPCWAGWKELYVNADGSVILCDGKLDFLAGRVGSVHEHTLQQLWRSPRMAERRAVIKQCTTPCLQNCYLRRESDSARGIARGALAHAERAVRRRLPPRVRPWQDALTLELCDVLLDDGLRARQLLNGQPAEAAAQAATWAALRDRGLLRFDRGFMGADVVDAMLDELRCAGRGVGILVLAGRGDPLLHPELDRIWAVCAGAVEAGLVREVRVRSSLERPLPAFARRDLAPVASPWVSWDGWLAGADDPRLQDPAGDALKDGLLATWPRLARA